MRNNRINTKSKITVGVVAVLTLGILVGIFVTVMVRSESLAEKGYWEENVVLSEDFDEFLHDNFYSCVIVAIEGALSEYFSSIYPEGIGLSLVDQDEEIENIDNFRIVASDGTFHTVRNLVEVEKLRVYVGVDEFEKVYSLECFDRDGEGLAEGDTDGDEL
ncbi:hypothetical protein IJH23_02060 [Candidatus Saccharibacteria bacterium]|nr:hypothetical protein [Candidatus Saccharibacteria bacterium]